VARTRGRFIRLLMMLSLIGVAAAVAAPFVPLSPLKDEVQRKLSDALGRKVTIDSARLNLLTGPYVTLTGMTAQESPAFGEGIFLRADQVRADIDLVQYLRTRRFVIDSITFMSPQITLIKTADGVWSWTTIGKQQSEEAMLSRVTPLRAMGFPASTILSFLWDGLSTPAFKKIRIENASVKLIDRTGSEPPEVLYKNISLSASLAPHTAGDSGSGTQAKGDLTAQSEEDGEAALLKTTLPFDLQIVRGASALSIGGSIGPGPIETRNLDVGAFNITGNIHSERGVPLAGNGQMSANQMFIRTINLSEQVSRALKVDQIGDMSPGTVIASLETDFQISKGTINTPGLRIQQLDGLGDATTQNGSFKIESALTVNYSATLIMSADATSRVKSIGPMVGILVTILETNDRISVPINISGDVRKPEIQVDVSRIF
jgi:uncharacterized protein involved in outer membrane biogenesis